MNEYSFDNLKNLAERKDLWIDVASNIYRDNNSGNTDNKERISRALSWYRQSEAQQCFDTKIIFSYIALNALYAQHKIGLEIQNNYHEKDGQTEKQVYNYDEEERKERNLFLESIVNCDKNKILLSFIKSQKEEIIELVGHQYLSQKFWLEDPNWKKNKNKRHKKVRDEIQKNNDREVLESILSCIRVLRNQMIHGSAGYCDWYNRSQSELCAMLLHSLVGRMIKIMLSHSEKNWGAVEAPPQAQPNAKTKKYSPLKN